MDALNEGAEIIQARINALTEGCPGPVILSGYSSRTGKVRGALCDNPIGFYPKPGEAWLETATIIREGSQTTEEHGESDDHSGE